MRKTRIVNRLYSYKFVRELEHRNPVLFYKRKANDFISVSFTNFFKIRMMIISFSKKESGYGEKKD